MLSSSHSADRPGNRGWNRTGGSGGEGLGARVAAAARGAAPAIYRRSPAVGRRTGQSAGGAVRAAAAALDASQLGCVHASGFGFKGCGTAETVVPVTAVLGDRLTEDRLRLVGDEADRHGGFPLGWGRAWGGVREKIIFDKLIFMGLWSCFSSLTTALSQTIRWSYVQAFARFVRKNQQLFNF